MNGKGQLMTSKLRVVNPRFTTVDEIRVFEIDYTRLQDRSEPYFFQLGKGEYRGARHVSWDEARLALGHDFKAVAEDRDILAMLGASDVSYSNAYFLGPNISVKSGVTRIPVAYFRISPEEHMSLIIGPEDDEFSGLIKQLRAQQK
jgi:hypothetical protein